MASGRRRKVLPRRDGQQDRPGDSPRRQDGADFLTGRSVILEVASVSKSFGSLRVADAVSFALADGDALGVIGPNGAGKSTLFGLISGSLRPSSGAIMLDGQNVTTESMQARCFAGIARAHQIPRPFGRLTVFENLLVAACFGRNVSEKNAVSACGEILERTGLIARSNERAGSLGLLDRKRLELARALATRPRILLLDEIAGGLTDAECDVLVEAIRDIKRAGTTIVWIEHIVHALLAVVDRLMVLDFGRKIAEGDPRAVMESAEVRAIYLGSPV